MKKMQSICHGLAIVFGNIILLEPWLIMANDSKNTIRSKGAENIWKHCQNINGDLYVYENETKAWLILANTD